jgi:hypothetical protein
VTFILDGCNFRLKRYSSSHFHQGETLISFVRSRNVDEVFILRAPCCVRSREEDITVKLDSPYPFIFTDKG